MKRLFSLILCVALCATAADASAKRNPDANGDGVLRILAIGNSFSDDGMEHLPALLENMGIKKVELARLYVGGCSVERHMQFFDKQQSAYTFYTSKAGENKWVKHAEKRSIQSALAMGEWDIITMQQASGYSGQYETIKPHLERLVAVVKKAQPQAHLAWHITWSYSTASKHQHYHHYDNSQAKMDTAIMQAVLQIRNDFDCFDYFIPSGTAIRMLRLSPVNNAPNDFTRDGYHLDYGAGRYAAACVWYETLVRPFAGKRVVDSSLEITNKGKGSRDATGDVARYSRRAAELAAKKPFKVREIKIK